ncbi:MAG: choice-of-anchor J domain-containing protein [Ruminiclostridium sp.]|nr:choice-of-anchor J domain-containing protein [Ruminiclostridium sp.]
MKKITFLVAFALISVFTFAQQSATREGSESNLKAVKVLNSINNLSPGAKSVVDSLHYDIGNEDAIGTGSAGTFGAYAFHSAGALSGHNANGNTITSVKMYINGITDITTTTLKIFSDQGVTSLVSQVFTPIEGWNEVVLTTPLAIPATDLYIGYEVTVTGGYPIGIDSATTPNLNGNWIVMDDEWDNLNNVSAALTGNWNIRAMVSGTPLTDPVATCTPLTWNAGEVIVGNNKISSTFALKNIGAGTLTVSGITGLGTVFTSTLVPASVSLTAGQTATFTFTYTPTAASTDNETAIIATNAGNISISLSGIGVECTALTAPYTQGFEGVFPPTCWTNLDEDGDNNYWVQATTPNTESHSGDNCAMSASWISGTILTPDNWLISPQFDINANNLELRFWVAAQDPDYPAEKYSVLVSTTGNSPADFTEIHSEVLRSDVYSEVILPLSTYNGQNIYIAFRHWDSSDNFQMKIDDFSVAEVSTVGVNSNSTSNYSVYPNPAKNSIRVESNQTINMVRILNVLGQEVYSEALSNNSTVINVSTLRSGIYFVNIETNEGVKTQRISIVR